jgi:hypothetical protein
MKIFWGVLALIVLAAGVYFWLGTDGYKNLSDNASSTYAEFLKKIAALNDIRQKGQNIWDNVSGFISDTEQKITGIKNFFETAPKTVSSTISDIYSQIKSQLPPAALKLLSGGVEEPLQGFISPGGQFSVSTSSASLAGNVCVEFNNGESVDYSIQNPFSPAKDYAYRIDWGDGASSEGNVFGADPSLSVTHHYGHSGDYENSFSITAASSTLKAQVRVCIH